MGYRINVIGKGNVGEHFVRALRTGKNAGQTEVRHISSRTLEDLDIEADLTIIAVSDSAIEEVAERLPELSGIVAHTSGATDISVLSRKFRHSAVFYPLQTLSAGKEVDYSRLPVLLEAAEKDDLGILERIAGSFSELVSRADSKARARLHVAAVFLNNFANHMIACAEEVATNEGQDIALLRPLLNETFRKLNGMSARDAQTGPARRGDSETIEIHKQILSDKPDLAALYETVSDSIGKMYRPK